MPYLIDGHNLIPKLGLRLDSPEDEKELIAILQEFCRQSRKTVDVYFDGAPAPHAGTRKLGSVTAHFVRLGDSADNAIQAPEGDGPERQKLDVGNVRPAGAGRGARRPGRNPLL